MRYGGVEWGTAVDSRKTKWDSFRRKKTELHATILKGRGKVYVHYGYIMNKDKDKGATWVGWGIGRGVGGRVGGQRNNAKSMGP